MKWYVWIAFALVLLATVLHYTIEPKPAHAEAKILVLYEKSDKEQEAEYCRQIGQGTKVRGATVSQIELHCMTR